jgi:hypothetical protein
MKIGNHAALEKAIEMAQANSGSIAEPVVDMGIGSFRNSKLVPPKRGYLVMLARELRNG